MSGGVVGGLIYKVCINHVFDATCTAVLCPSKHQIIGTSITIYMHKYIYIYIGLHVRVYIYIYTHKICTHSCTGIYVYANRYMWSCNCGVALSLVCEILAFFISWQLVGYCLTFIVVGCVVLSTVLLIAKLVSNDGEYIYQTIHTLFQ